MDTTEWNSRRPKFAELEGESVRVVLVNGHAVVGILTGVGYAGLRLLPLQADREVSYAARLVTAVETAHPSPVQVPE